MLNPELLLLLENAELSSQDRVLYMQVWDGRKHICEDCDSPLHEPRLFMFHHLLEKREKDNKAADYSQFRHCAWNIALLCWECHDAYERNPLTRPKIHARRAALIVLIEEGYEWDRFDIWNPNSPVDLTPIYQTLGILPIKTPIIAMFQQLEPHLDRMNLSITLAKKGDVISFAILPKGKDTNADLGIIPLVGSATAEQLDEQIAGIIERGLGMNSELVANLAEFSDNAEKKKRSNDKTTAAATPAATAGKKDDKKGPAAAGQRNKAAANSGKLADQPGETAGDDEEEEDDAPETPQEPVVEAPKVVNSAKLKGNEKKAWDKIQDALQKAATSTDPDMVNFLRNGALKEAVNVKSQADVAKAEVGRLFDAIANTLNEKLGANQTPAGEGLFKDAAQPKAEEASQQLQAATGGVNHESTHFTNDDNAADLAKKADAPAPAAEKPAEPVVPEPVVETPAEKADGPTTPAIDNGPGEEVEETPEEEERGADQEELGSQALEEDPEPVDGAAPPADPDDVDIF